MKVASDTLEKQIKDRVMTELFDYIHIGLVGKVFLSPRQTAQIRRSIISQMYFSIEDI